MKNITNRTSLSFTTHPYKIWNYLNHKDFDVFVTLTTREKGFCLQQLKNFIDWSCCIVEKKMLHTPHYNKMPPEKRIVFIGFPEHIFDDELFPHYHLLLRFPKYFKDEYPSEYISVFTKLLEEAWKKFVKPNFKLIEVNGKMRFDRDRFCDVQKVESQGVVNYVTKDLFKPEHDNHIIFHNFKSK